MRHSFKVGICFGTTSGIITTIGLMIGLYSVTNSRLAVIGGILTIAIADSLSDAMGIHISEESENKHTSKEIWESTICTLLSKFVIASSFIIPVIILDLKIAIYVSIVWGLSLLCILSYYISCDGKAKSWRVVLEHLTIAIVVMIAAYYVGHWIAIIFG